MWFKLFKKVIESKMFTNKNSKLVELALQKNIQVLADLNINIKRSSNDFQIILKDIHMLEQKFDLLCNMLGIEIAADLIHNPPKAFVKKILDRSLFSSASKYVDKTIIAEKILQLQYKMYNQQIELFKDIKWR